MTLQPVRRKHRPRIALRVMRATQRTSRPCHHPTTAGGQYHPMRRVLLAHLVLLICTPAAAQDRTQVAGYETYAVVGPVADDATALPFAERHCAKYNRFTYFRRMDGVKAIFDCTPQQVERKPVGVARRWAGRAGRRKSCAMSGRHDVCFAADDGSSIRVLSCSSR